MVYCHVDAVHGNDMMGHWHHYSYGILWEAFGGSVVCWCATWDVVDYVRIFELSVVDLDENYYYMDDGTEVVVDSAVADIHDVAAAGAMQLFATEMEGLGCERDFVRGIVFLERVLRSPMT